MCRWPTNQTLVALEDEFDVRLFNHCGRLNPLEPWYTIDDEGESLLGVDRHACGASTNR